MIKHRCVRFLVWGGWVCFVFLLNMILTPNIHRHSNLRLQTQASESFTTGPSVEKERELAD